MKLVWSPETASLAYIDAVKTSKHLLDPEATELVAAMAAGWNAKLIVETWSKGSSISTSIALNIASKHTEGRHVCIVPDTQSRSAYLQAMEDSSYTTEVIVGEPRNAMETLNGGIDFLAVDWRMSDFAADVLRLAEFGDRGAVVVCQNAFLRPAVGFSWKGVFGNRVVRSVVLPVGGGLDIAHVAATRDGLGSSRKSGKSRWVKHFDQMSGEEHVIRK